MACCYAGEGERCPDDWEELFHQAQDRAGSSGLMPRLGGERDSWMPARWLQTEEESRGQIEDLWDSLESGRAPIV